MWQKRNKKRILKGSVTVFALLLMFILAVTTIGIISTAAIERKVSISTGNSTTAFQVAESGMERTLQYFKSNFDKKLIEVGSCSGGSVTYSSNNTIRFKNNAPMPAYITDCNELISKVKIIKSIGTTKQETRAIEEDVFLGATKLLLHLNGKNESGNFEDSSFYWNNHTITTSGGVSESESELKLGEGSANFDGTGYLSIPGGTGGVDFNFKAGDFTIDWWEYRSSGNGYAIVQRRSDSVGYPLFVAGLNWGTGDLKFYLTDDGTGWDVVASMGTPIYDNWTHYAIVRKVSTSNLYTFQNGQLKDTKTLASSFTINDTSDPLEIGRFTSGGFNYYFNGYIDEFRISKGVARWTTNFNPYNPTAEYWAD